MRARHAENPSAQADKMLQRCLKKMKSATGKNNEEQFLQADMELHHTIWKAANQPLLYRTLDSMMNPYIFIIAREYSSRAPMTARRDNHEHYVKVVLTTPLTRVEREVERYFDRLYRNLFHHGHQLAPPDSAGPIRNPLCNKAPSHKQKSHLRGRPRTALRSPVVRRMMSSIVLTRGIPDGSIRCGSACDDRHACPLTSIIKHEWPILRLGDTG